MFCKGIDIPHLDNIINFSFPSNPKTFVHRIGRVSRIEGRYGRAFALVGRDELPYMAEFYFYVG